MTRGEVIKHFLVKSILPMEAAPAACLHLQIRLYEGWNTGLCVAMILCGLPFGLHRVCLWLTPCSRSFGGGIAVAVFGFIIGGVIGGFFLVWACWWRHGICR